LQDAVRNKHTEMAIMLHKHGAELGYDDVTASGELCELAAPLVQKYPLPCVRMAPHLPPWTV
jgi:hypothetical protein